MNIDVERTNEVLVISLSGRLDANTSPLFEEKILNLGYVKECIVTVKKKNKVSIIVAKIYMEEVNEKLDEDIKKINESLPNYMNIDEFEIMDKEFEKNSSKKIIRSKYVK